MIKFKNVYIDNTSLVAGPLEKDSPYKKYFDKTYNDYYMDKTYELSEVKMQNDAINILLKKENKKVCDIDLLLGGDLLNQITVSNYAAKQYDIPYLGLFSACATSMEEIIVAATFIDAGKINNAIATVSSHNLAAEKQFRNPVEYGAPKKATATFTSTGAASILLSNNPSNVKVVAATIGKVIDFDQKDVNNMGKVMVPSCADTIVRHLNESNKTISDYDLILSGDLGIYGKGILEEYLQKEYDLNLDKKYNDCGAMLYDMQKQSQITAGGSGPVCSSLINYGYIYNLLETKKIKRVLFVTTGALFSPTFVYQKQVIPSIAHAVEVESI